MNRTNRILAGVLALQIVLVAVIFWPRSAAPVAGAEGLLPGLEVDQIVGLTIADAEGQHIKLAKVGAGWALPEADDYPCLDGKVPDLLEKIVALKANRLVTQTPGSHKRLQVADDDFQRQIALELASGETRRFYIGSSPSYGTAHVRAEGQDEVYLVSNLSATDAGVQASSWVDALYFSVPQDQVVALALENGNGRFVFEKDDAGAWTMTDLAEGEIVNENNITSLLNQAYSRRMTRPLGKTELAEYGLSNPTAVITLETRDEAGNAKTYTLRVGAQSEEDKSYVASSSASPFYVRVADYTVSSFIEKTRDDFLQVPPTPTPEPTP